MPSGQGIPRGMKGMEMEFKICVIGCGDHSSLVHGPSLQKYASLRTGTLLAACCDLNFEKSLAYGRSFGFKHHYTDWREMLQIEKPDAISLILPPLYTPAVAKPILEQGIPLLLEKPPARTGDELLTLVEAARKRGTHTRVAFNRRYMPVMRQLKEELETCGASREIQHINYDMVRVNRVEKDFHVTAIHAVDAVRWIAGAEYRSVQIGYQEVPGMQGVENILLDCVFASGATARITICPVSGVVMERVAVYSRNHAFLTELPMGTDLSRGGLAVYEKGLLQALRKSKQEDGPALFQTGGFYYENATFFDAIREGRIPSGSLEDAVQSVRIAECLMNRQTHFQETGEDIM